MKQLSQKTEASISALYEAFSRIRKPAKIEACPCCLTEGEVTRLLKKPLRDLAAEDLDNYLSALFLTSGSTDDFRYFLPRLFELNIRSPGCFISDWEILLERLHQGDWHRWADAERKAVLDLIDAVVTDYLAEGSAALYDFCKIICGIARARLDTGSYLEYLLLPENKSLLEAYEADNARHVLKGKLSNPFWSDVPEERSKVVAWLRSTQVQAALSAR